MQTMGKVERLPGSKPLGPIVGGEIKLDQGSPKATKRAIGVAESTMRASRHGMIPVSVKEDEVSAHLASVHAAQELSEYLQGVRPSSVEVVGVDDFDKERVREVVVYSSGDVQPRIEDAAKGSEFEQDALALCTEQSRRVAGDRAILEDDLIDRIVTLGDEEDTLFLDEMRVMGEEDDLQRDFDDERARLDHLGDRT
jgi:hypothetical protein